MTLRGMRERAGWTQQELADKADIRQTSVSALESGQVLNPTMRILENLARAFNCPVDDVIAAVRETGQSIAARLGQPEANTLAPQLPLIGEARAPRPSCGALWLLPIVAASIDACMSRKEAAIRLGINEGTLSRQISGEDGK